ncbi:MAG: ATP-binding protein [Christensenellaceae bacterium]|nr:ATP-binding protein [Christensenellaceae bacterium]
MDRLEELLLSWNALVIFRGLKTDGVLSRLAALLSANEDSAARRVDAYAAFAEALFAHTCSLTEYVKKRVMEDDNFYIRRCAQGLPIEAELEACLKAELHTLGELAALDSETVRKSIGYEGYLPAWRTEPVDLEAEFRAHLGALNTRGFGMYAAHRMFAVRQGVITPVKNPDSVRLSDLKGYERQKRAIVDNTLALLGGRPAANVLLYGDAGTGKSSTVKALVNEYADRGLRLVEIGKAQAGDIPAVLEELRGNPLKFILFIDDLSFAQENDDFYTLKAVLEGSASARTGNVAVYATSNRRHLVRERFSEREGDDVHRNETIQELTALSARFGLTLGYFKPNRREYLEIVRALAEDYGINMDAAVLEAGAEQFALSGRSPRAARQYIDSLRRG